MEALSKITPAKIGRALAWRYRDMQPVLRAAATWRGERPRVYLHNVHPHPVFRTYLTHPTLKYAPYPVADLCHWVDMLPNDRLLAKPHIVEVEHPLIFAENRRRPMADWFRMITEIDAINGRIARNACRRVVTFSAGLVEHAKHFLRPEVWPKLTYVYPAYPSQPLYEKASGGPFQILTIASRFSDKGVPEAIRAFEILRERYRGDVVMKLVSQDVPASFPLPDGLTHHDVPRMAEDFKRRLYQSADVLLLPCYSETAACFTEACAFGLPIVTTRIHHGDEFVQPGVNGYLLDPPVYIYSPGYGTRWKTAEEFLADLALMRARGELENVVEQCVDRVATLIDDQRLSATLRDGARRIHAQKFSPEVRNARLMALYKQAMAGA